MVRRVVTGHNESGEAVFASDEDVPAFTPRLMPGAEFYHMWGADDAQSFPDTGAMPPRTTHFPPIGGFRFQFFALPPAASIQFGDDGDNDGAPVSEADLVAATAELEREMGGLRDHMDPDDPGMHISDTIDLIVIMAGEAVLELDDGVEKVMRAGDTVVQNGTRHRWHNRHSEPALLAAFIVGANRAS